jgi:hypothetical protein
MTKDSLVDYFKDIFNLADIAKSGSMWLYIFFILFGNGSKGHHGLAAFLNFFLFSKIFTGLNQYRRVRILFRLVK